MLSKLILFLMWLVENSAMNMACVPFYGAALLPALLDSSHCNPSVTWLAPLQHPYPRYLPSSGRHHSPSHHCSHLDKGKTLLTGPESQFLHSCQFDLLEPCTPCFLLLKVLHWLLIAVRIKVPHAAMATSSIGSAPAYLSHCNGVRILSLRTQPDWPSLGSSKEPMLTLPQGLCTRFSLAWNSLPPIVTCMASYHQDRS